jgi:hypothetical protein
MARPNCRRLIDVDDHHGFADAVGARHVMSARTVVVGL